MGSTNPHSSGSPPATQDCSYGYSSYSCLVGFSYISTFSPFEPIVFPAQWTLSSGSIMSSLQMIPSHNLCPWALHMNIHNLLYINIQMFQEAPEIQNQYINVTLLLWFLSWLKGSSWFLLSTVNSWLVLLSSFWKMTKFFHFSTIFSYVFPPFFPSDCHRSC